jgi:hypothetical protein
MGVSKTIRGLKTLILIVNSFFHDEYFIQPTKMKCCALCGVVKLSHHNQHFKINTYNISFYKIVNGIIIEYITNEIGQTNVYM